jgi:hypothetical protein
VFIFSSFSNLHKDIRMEALPTAWRDTAPPPVKKLHASLTSLYIPYESSWLLEFLFYARVRMLFRAASVRLRLSASGVEEFSWRLRFRSGSSLSLPLSLKMFRKPGQLM